MQELPIPTQSPLEFNPQVKHYGRNWLVGFEWMAVTLGSSRPVTGLGFYIQHKKDPARTYLCFTVREAVAFAERCGLPPKIFGRFLNEAVAMGGKAVPQEFQIP